MGNETCKKETVFAGYRVNETSGDLEYDFEAAVEAEAEPQRAWRRKLQFICRDAVAAVGEGEVWKLFTKNGRWNIPHEVLCSKEVRLCPKKKRRGAKSSEL